MKHILPVLAALCGLSLTSLAAHAEEAMIKARILTGWSQQDGQHVAGLQLTMQDGWKTYWRAPGDAGIPPRFDWRGSRNLAGVQITWPTPRAIDQGGQRAIGYRDTVTLPLTLTPRAQGEPISLSGKIEMGVCKDICVPVTLSLSQELPHGETRRDPQIVAALASRPESAQEAGVKDVRCTVTPVEGGLQLTAEMRMPAIGHDEIAVVEAGDDAIWVAQPRTERDGERLVASTELYHVEGDAFALDRSAIRITVIGGQRAVDIRGCPAR
ncbi:MAG: protein-disulfide reductase DsbD domain-containing protein [Pseudomonadota bacterium]|nr:protein-disulfide reductase DsbD domain-containing protein [Roseovarius sp. EGI FJ00037]MCZ0813220.1 protein-disulfide reductase DsbD family protein [Roseovarius sp. EGI FJ00037]